MPFSKLLLGFRLPFASNSSELLSSSYVAGDISQTVPAMVTIAAAAAAAATSVGVTRDCDDMMISIRVQAILLIR